MNGNQFSFVMPDSSPNWSISIQNSFDLGEDWVDCDTLSSDLKAVSDATSSDEGAYIRRTLTLDGAQAKRFLRVDIVDDSLPGI